MLPKTPLRRSHPNISARHYGFKAVLSRSYASLQSQTAPKAARIRAASSPSSEDEDWLDNVGNLMNEHLLNEHVQGFANDHEAIAEVMRITTSPSDVVDGNMRAGWVSLVQFEPSLVTLLCENAAETVSDALANTIDLTSSPTASPSPSAPRSPSPSPARLVSSPLAARRHPVTPPRHHAPHRHGSRKRTPTPLSPIRLSPSSLRSIRKPQRHTNKMKLTIVEWHITHGLSQAKTAAHWSAKLKTPITQRRLSEWINKQDKLQAHVEANPYAAEHRRIALPQEPELEKCLILWVETHRRNKMVVTGPALKKQLLVFGKELGINPDNLPNGSDGWLAGFKARHGLRAFAFHGEAASVDDAAVAVERARLQALLSGWDTKDIFNADETAFFYKRVPSRGLATGPMAGRKQKKDRISVLLIVNADGSYRRELFIGRYLRPQCFHGRQAEDHGLDYHANANAWMTSNIYSNWLERWDRDLARSKRKIVLIQDNFAAHKIPKGGLQWITLVNLKPNMTSHIQPLDMGIIAALKRAYGSAFLERALNRVDAEVPYREAYDINVLDAMQLLTGHWLQVSNPTIIRCWLKSGILPCGIASELAAATKVSNTRIQSDNVTNRAVDGLRALGILGPTISIEDVVDEQGGTFTSPVSVKDIVETVKGARCGVEDGDTSDDEEFRPKRQISDLHKACQDLREAVMDLGLAPKPDFYVQLSQLQREARKRADKTNKQSSLLQFFS